MLNTIQAELRELLKLVEETTSYNATIAASNLCGKPITPEGDADESQRRKIQRIVQIKQKYDL